MEDFMPFDTEFDAEMSDTQLILHVDAQTEQNFLSRFNVETARKEQIGALADQYFATHIETLCFDGTDEKALKIWVARCRALGMTPMLRVDAEKERIDEAFRAGLTSGIVLDCRETQDLSVIADAAQLHTDLAPEALLYVLLCADVQMLKEQNVDLSDMDAVIVCSAEKRCDGHLSVVDWMSENTDIGVFAGIDALLCETNGKKYYPTAQIMNGFAVGYLSQGCNGLWLDGFCADLFDSDPVLYDIYETCGKLEECVGARRRHVLTGTYPKALLPGADYRCNITLGPVFEGAPVCAVVGILNVQTQECIAVTLNGKQAACTGNPSVVARNEKGRERSDFCGGKVLFAEYFAGTLESESQLQINLHNNTDKCLQIAWIEVTVNV